MIVTGAAYPTVALTGHRPKYFTPSQASWVRDSLAHVAARLREHYATTTAISGMALGTDTWWAQSVLEAGLELHTYIPFPQQADNWDRAQVVVWNDLRRQAAKDVVLGDHYSVGLLHARNAAMIAAADAVVAVWRPDVTAGGTFDAVVKAKRSGRRILHVDPAASSVGWLAPDYDPRDKQTQ